MLDLLYYVLLFGLGLPLAICAAQWVLFAGLALIATVVAVIGAGIKAVFGGSN